MRRDRERGKQRKGKGTRLDNEADREKKEGEEGSRRVVTKIQGLRKKAILPLAST